MPDNRPAPDEAQLYLDPANDHDVELTDIRVNLVALTRWLNRRFLIREGMPVPVIWATPMDAFSQFNRLWNQPNSPYNYLREKHEYPGREPAQLRFPLISVDWRGLRYRPGQSYATRVNRRVDWPTVSSTQEGLHLQDLGNVRQARLPAAYDFKYQIDFWCSRPDTQAIYVKQLNNCFKRLAASVPQTYIPVVYPGYFGVIAQRLVLESDIDDVTEKEPQENEIRYRTSVTVAIEGYAVDQSTVVTPTVWRVVAAGSAVDPDALKVIFGTYDLRDGTVVNPIVVQRQGDMPPAPPEVAPRT